MVNRCPDAPDGDALESLNSFKKRMGHPALHFTPSFLIWDSCCIVCVRIQKSVALAIWWLGVQGGLVLAAAVILVLLCCYELAVMKAAICIPSMPSETVLRPSL